MLSLRELDAHFIRLNAQGFRRVDSLEEAHGLLFLCPKCFLANKGPVGTHTVLCFFRGRGVPDDEKPGPGRWNPAGTGLDDLSFVGPEQCSVDLRGSAGCRWHGNVLNGRATLE